MVRGGREVGGRVKGEGRQGGKERGREGWRGGRREGREGGKGGREGGGWWENRDRATMHIASYFQISHDGRQLIKDHFTGILQLNRAKERYYR